MNQQVFFVGTRAEVQHHAAPLSGQIQYKIVDSADVVAAAQPGDLAIFYSEHFDRFREAIQQLKEKNCLLYTSPSPRDRTRSRMPSSA